MKASFRKEAVRSDTDWGPLCAKGLTLHLWEQPRAVAVVDNVLANNSKEWKAHSEFFSIMQVMSFSA